MQIKRIRFWCIKRNIYVLWIFDFVSKFFQVVKKFKVFCNFIRKINFTLNSRKSTHMTISVGSKHILFICFSQKTEKFKLFQKWFELKSPWKKSTDDRRNCRTHTRIFWWLHSPRSGQRCKFTSDTRSNQHYIIRPQIIIFISLDFFFTLLLHIFLRIMIFSHSLHHLS